jgi:peptidoglycan/xylan/chitin deacetylase (PgdA/CDA1 family)
MTALACFTFDNMGEAADVGGGTDPTTSAPHPSLVVGLPRIIELLANHDARSTFFVEGWNGVHHPREVASIVDRGHELGMHGWVHERWGELDPDEERELAARATDALTSAAGQRPAVFRAPGGARTRSTEEILRALGYRADASLAEGGKRGVHRLPAGLPSVPFVWTGVDGYWYLRADPAPPDAVRDAWLHALDRLAASGGVFVVIVHAFITGVDEDRLAALDSVIDAAMRRSDVRVCTIGEAAASLEA